MFVLRSWLRILLFPTLILTGTAIKRVFAQTPPSCNMETRLDQDYSQNLPNYQPKLHKDRHKCLYQIFSYLKLRPIANDRSRDRSCDYLALFSLGLFGASSEPWRVTTLTSRALKLYDSKT